MRTYCTSGTSSTGCSPSLSADGVPSATAANGFTIVASEVTGQNVGLFFYGISGRQSLPWSDWTNTLCVRGPLQRVPPQMTGGSAWACDGSLTLDFNAYLATHPSTLGQPVLVGQGFNVQALVRDSSFPSGILSDALEFWLAP